MFRHVVRVLAERDPSAASALSSGGKLVRNVVFMGMGEPFNNYHRMCDAVKALTDRKPVSSKTNRHPPTIEFGTRAFANTCL